MTDLMDAIKQTISEFNVSTDAKSECFKKTHATLIALIKSGKIVNGTPIRVETTESDLLLFDDSTKECIFDYSFDTLKNRLISKSDEMEKLIDNEKLFQKGLKLHPDDAMFYLHCVVNKYLIGTCAEFMNEVKRFEKSSGERLVLHDCNIRTCKLNGRKYKRITFQNEKHIQNVSKVEFCFGHMIHGWTYIFIPKKWNEIKKEVLTLVDYKTSTFGSKTRVDISGNEYKVSH